MEVDAFDGDCFGWADVFAAAATNAVFGVEDGNANVVLRFVHGEGVAFAHLDATAAANAFFVVEYGVFRVLFGVGDGSLGADLLAFEA